MENGENQDTTKAAADALEKVLEVLRDLRPGARQKVLETAAVFYDVRPRPVTR